MPPPPDRYAPPSYGLVRPTDGRGLRFVAYSLTEAQAQALEQLAQQLGIRPTDTSRFLTESKSH